jgi:glycosyltransferase involved in cell wall biosynthesis
MKVLLVGNYAADKQESMSRFCQVLEVGLKDRGFEVRVTRPEILFARWVSEQSPLRKWLGYIDKIIIFPRRLRKEVAWADVVHICDHSNSYYASAAASKPSLVTCHDMLAVRSAQGDFPENITGWSGRIYQKLILRGIRKSPYIACVSQATQKDVQRLAGKGSDSVCVVYNGLNYPYTPMSTERAVELLAQRGFKSNRKFLLHVGGNQWYKNRMGVLRIFSELLKYTETSHLDLILAGKTWTDEMRAYIHSNNLQGRVIELNGLANEELRALYSLAKGFIFPSLHEGFGWPVIEAHACGCPVFTTGHPPMTEVGGECAVYIDPRDAGGAAKRIAHALAANEGGGNPAIDNAARFAVKNMLDGYVTMYEKIAGCSRSEKGFAG